MVVQGRELKQAADRAFYDRRITKKLWPLHNPKAPD
jgi:hypothetical protein